MARHRDGRVERGDHAARIRAARAGQIQRGAVIDRRADDRQPERDIDALAERRVLQHGQALIVEHRLTVGMAYGMIGLGAGLLILATLLRAVFHWRRHRQIRQQVA